MTQEILNVFEYWSSRNKTNFINMACKVARVGDAINWGLI